MPGSDSRLLKPATNASLCISRTGRGIPKLVIEVSQSSRVSLDVGKTAVAAALALRRVVKRAEQLMKEPRVETLENPVWVRLAAPESAP